MYPAVVLTYLIRAAVILLVSLSLIVQFLMPYKGMIRTGAFCSLIVAFFFKFCVS